MSVPNNNKSASSSAHKKKIEDYKQELLKEAEIIVEQKFPSKVVEFNELLKNPKYQYARLAEITALTDVNSILPVPCGGEQTSGDEVAKKLQKLDCQRDTAALLNGTPVYGFAKGSVNCNEKLAELIDELRPLLRDAIEDVNKLDFGGNLTQI